MDEIRPLVDEEIRLDKALYHEQPQSRETKSPCDMPFGVADALIGQKGKDENNASSLCCRKILKTFHLYFHPFENL